MRRFGFGIVGCGAISEAHIEVVKSIPEAELVAVADIVKEKAESVALKHGCAAYADYEEMFKRDDIQIVSICTGSGLHMEAAVAAARAGKHVIVEKPLEVTLDRADAIIKACEENKVKLAGVFQSRFFEATRLVHGAVQEGKFGKLVLGDAYVKWYRSQEYYDQGSWRGTWRFDGGGALMNQSIHSVDLLQWMMGPVKTVKAYTACLAHERVEVEDTAVAVVQFASGALGVIEGTTSVKPGYPKRLEIHGSEGTCVLVDDVLSELKGGLFSEDERQQLMSSKKKGESANYNNPMAFSFDGHKGQFEDFISAIKNDTKPVVDGYEARKSIEIILAIYASAQSGCEVSLPLK